MNIPQGDYGVRELCRTILETPNEILFENLHVHQIKIFLFLTSVEEWPTLFESYQSSDYGSTLKISKNFYNRAGQEREAVFYAAEWQDGLILVITGAVEDGIRQTLDVTVNEYDDLEPMPIFPADFQEMNDYVISSYEDMGISEFKAVRQPDLADAEIRPEVEDRIVEYYGSDGRISLDEFRQYYGVVPIRVQYLHDNIEFKMDADGKFTLTTINDDTFNLFFDLIERVVEHIIEIQEISENIRFRTETRQSGDLDVPVPRLTSGQVRLTRDFNLLLAEHFMEHLSSQEVSPYTFSDVTKQAGSLDLSARVTDERRKSHFNVSATEEAITIVPRKNCAWGSILQFYHLFTQSVDEGAELRLQSGPGGPPAG